VLVVIDDDAMDRVSFADDFAKGSPIAVFAVVARKLGLSPAVGAGLRAVLDPARLAAGALVDDGLFPAMPLLQATARPYGLLNRDIDIDLALGPVPSPRTVDGGPHGTIRSDERVDQLQAGVDVMWVPPLREWWGVDDVTARLGARGAGDLFTHTFPSDVDVHAGRGRRRRLVAGPARAPRSRRPRARPPRHRRRAAPPTSTSTSWRRRRRRLVRLRARQERRCGAAGRAHPTARALDPPKRAGAASLSPSPPSTSTSTSTSPSTAATATRRSPCRSAGMRRSRRCSRCASTARRAATRPAACARLTTSSRCPDVVVPGRLAREARRGHAAQRSPGSSQRSLFRGARAGVDNGAVVDDAAARRHETPCVVPCGRV
jgi:hypothetical protein